jgi:hypothetical protein
MIPAAFDYMRPSSLKEPSQRSTRTATTPNSLPGVIRYCQ